MSVSQSNELRALSGIQGGYAPLDSGLLVPRAYLPQIAGLLHNMGASAAPTVNDDSGDGYGVGSRWLDTTNDREYVCLDATVGAAVWLQTTTGGVIGGGWTSYTPTLTGSTTDPTIGGSTLSGAYKLLDAKTCALRIYLLVNTGGGWSAGSGNWRFALPFTAAGKQALPFIYTDSGTSYYVGTGSIGGVSNSVIGPLAIAQAPNTSSPAGAVSIGHNIPVVPATGDEYQVSGIYEIA